MTNTVDALNDLKHHIALLRPTRKQQIHWIAVGCSMATHVKYELKYDQEYPYFLRQLKNENDIELNLVLIDPGLEEPPLCVCDVNKKQEQSYIKKNNMYSHIEDDINIFCYPTAVGYIYDPQTINITQWLHQYILFCQQNNYLLFLHDFTNRGLETLRKHFAYVNYKLVMIGISPVEDQNHCHMDLTELHNQPVILKNKHSLEIWSPYDETTNPLVEQYKNCNALVDVLDEAKQMREWITSYIETWIDDFINSTLPIYRQIFLKIKPNALTLEKLFSKYTIYISEYTTLIDYQLMMEIILKNFCRKLYKTEDEKNNIADKLFCSLHAITDIYKLQTVVKEILNVKSLLE